MTYRRKPTAAAIPTSRASPHVLFESSHALDASAAIETIDPAGRENAGRGTALLRRRTGSAAHVAAYVISLMMVLIATAETNVLNSVSPSMTAAESRIAMWGV